MQAACANMHALFVPTARHPQGALIHKRFKRARAALGIRQIRNYRS
jgi:hypothetical protein